VQSDRRERGESPGIFRGDRPIVREAVRIVDAFFKSRYGAGLKDLADDDKAIREALKAAF
jgi:hypothetical protein